MDVRRDVPALDRLERVVRPPARAAGAEDLWLAFEPPDTGQPMGADAYLQAIADTEIAGARWVVSLDPWLRVGLAEGRAEARETWAQVARGLAFFEAHRAWRTWEPVGQIGVLSDYAGENEFMAFEVVNLLARRSGLFRVLEAGRAEAEPFDGLDSCCASTPPRPRPREEAHAFAEAAARRHAAVAARGCRTRFRPPRFRVYRCGRGGSPWRARTSATPTWRRRTRSPDQPPSRPPPRLQPGAGSSTTRRAPTVARGAAHDRLPDAVPAGRWRPGSASRGPAVASCRSARDHGEGAVADGGVEFHLSAPPVYTALEVSA
jgi:hypothetical protein